MPDIVKKVFERRADGRFQVRADGHLPQVDLLRAVPRDRLQLRQPPDGGGGHLLLRQAHRRPQHAWCSPIPPASTRRLPATRRFRSSRPSRSCRPELEHISSWDFSREIQPGVYVHDDYDLERPSVEIKTRKALTRSVHAERLRGLRLPGPLPAEGGRRTVRGRAHRRARQPVRDVRRRSATAKGVVCRVAVHARGLPARGSEPRAPDSGGELRPGVQRIRGDAGGRRHRATGAASSRCRASSSSGRSAARPSRSCRGRRRRWSSGPAGDEIYTDKFGRVKVQFHWDRLRQEGREQLVLDPRVAAVGGQGVGLGRRRRASARR